MLSTSQDPAGAFNHCVKAGRRVARAAYQSPRGHGVALALATYPMDPLEEEETMPNKPKPPSGRPPGRRGKGGIGPGPGYKTGGTGKGTTHGKKKGSAGAGQTRPPQGGCGKKKPAATLIAVPAVIAWTALKLAFGWRPQGYKPADVPWPWETA